MGGDGAGEHLLFQLIANHDVQAIGELVGLGADQGGLGAVHHAVELLLRHVHQLLREVLLQPRQQDGAEGPAAADDVLVEPGLALMDAHGDAVSRQVRANSRPVWSS